MLINATNRPMRIDIIQEKHLRIFLLICCCLQPFDRRVNLSKTMIKDIVNGVSLVKDILRSALAGIGSRLFTKGDVPSVITTLSGQFTFDFIAQRSEIGINQCYFCWEILGIV